MVAHNYNTLIQQAETGLLNLREHPEEYEFQVNMSLHSKALSQKTPNQTSIPWPSQVNI